MRDLSDGLITLGAGASKGYGACNAIIRPVDLAGLPVDLDPGLRAWFEKDATPGEWPSEADISTDETPLEDGGSSGDDRFYNPYHFVPVEPLNKEGLPTLADLRGGLSLDRYHEGLLTGYFDCLLTAETPFFVGGGQRRDEEGGQAQEAKPYRRDGKVAIPATSLRGLISAQFETLTNSSLRVMENSYYSVRKPMSESLSAVGLVVKRGGDFYVRPLTVPFLIGRRPPYPPVWKTLFPEPVVATYVGTRYEIRRSSWINQHPNWQPGRPLVRRAARHARWQNDPLRVNFTGEAEVDGIWRTLGCEARQIPPNKIHELFLPAPFLNGFQCDSDAEPEEGLVALPQTVIERLHRIADQMTAQWRAADGLDLRPYEPIGTRPERYGKDARKTGEQKLRLRAGDVVYFEIDQHGVVSEVSFSAIWRQETPRRTFGFFQLVDQDLLPMSDVRRSGRKDEQIPVTPAEKLFGFVEMREARSRTRTSGAGGPHPVCGRRLYRKSRTGTPSRRM